MAWAGYQHLTERYSLPCIAPAVPAQVQPVTRILRDGDRFQVPQAVAPGPQASAVDHLLFALRYEGVDIAVVDALAHAGAISDAQVRDAVNAAPASAFGRKLGYLWELVTGRAIEGLQAARGAYVDLYDADLYFTGDAIVRNAKWRVRFNGLGSPAWCPTVRRTRALEDMLARDLFQEVTWFAEQARQSGMLERVLSWAYLAETTSSYEIEHEPASEDRAQAFVRALQEGHQAMPLDERYLTELQHTISTHPMQREDGYRRQQNWLSRGGRGALAVRYVPPAPGALASLMQDFCAAANQAAAARQPLIQSALNSFGFVYLHPFMDGNGRLSRFLFHHALCVAKVLPDGLILPVSAAMRRDEPGYLSALETFSRPARQLWRVTWIDGSDYAFEQRCRDSVYRYWDATAQAEFAVRMAAQAMDVHLVGEARFLSGFDRALAELDKRLELPSQTLHKLVLMCHDNGGVLSANRRRQFDGIVPPEYFDAVEEVVRESFAISPLRPGERSRDL
ncbi:MAG: Fic family protein [Ramlibacter sp.]